LKLVLLILDIFLHLLKELKDLWQQQMFTLSEFAYFYVVSSTFSTIWTMSKTWVFKIFKNGLIC